jgi:GLPGLI family protein
MRLLLIFIFSGIYISCFSQKKGDAQIEYQLFCNTDSPTTLFTSLYVSNNVSIYQEKYSTAKDWEENKKQLPTGVTVFGGTSQYDPYLKIDQNKKEMFFFSKILSNNFLVKDNYYEFTWDISSETKVISGYPCVKATTDFRGRKWVAWFAPGIPLPFGPWKLHGLPGLILETYDVDKKYTIKVLEIVYKKNDVFGKDFETLMETKNSKPVSYQQFLQDTEEAKDNAFRRISDDKNATITRLPVARDGEELKYEWEP